MGTLARRFLWVVALVGLVAVGIFATKSPRENVSCGAGFYAIGARCCPGPEASATECLSPSSCPPPLVLRGLGCDAPDDRVTVPETTLQVGPSDWEAEGRVAPRTVHAGPFQLDAFEATLGHLSPRATDGSRAASGLTRSAAASYCERRGGRLPTEDEWIVAAAGPSAWRYPWGETGAVCRRAAFGLAAGPCAAKGTGPDTVGAHVSGDTPTGLHDMAGNVAEWVAPSASDGRMGVARGGSWRSALATELRTWVRLELDPDRPDDRVGVRCAYDPR
jgi:formylglycine-generating enzyme required for sulfatase activity